MGLVGITRPTTAARAVLEMDRHKLIRGNNKKRVCLIDRLCIIAHRKTNGQGKNKEIF